MDSILKLEDVSFGYNNELILENINLDILECQFVGILGLNGSGKSTLLKLFLGILKPTIGSVIRRKDVRVGYVNQTTTTEEGGFPTSVFEVVSLGLRKKPFSIINKVERERVNSILALFNLSEYANKSLESLSGGQTQKVKIAKVLVSDPDIIVLDEPTTGIDEDSEKVLLEMIDYLHNLKKTIILVSHNKDNFKNCDVLYKVSNKTIKKVEVEEDV